MARASATTTTSTRKPATRAASGPAKATRGGRTQSGAGPAEPSPFAKMSKEELRAQAEKLERANAKLRAKSREFGRAGKQAADRIAELESEVARLERQVKRQTPKTGGSAPTRRSRRRDPGDGVPPGIAVEEPEPLDKEAETALAALEEHLPGEAADEE